MAEDTRKEVAVMELEFKPSKRVEAHIVVDVTDLEEIRKEISYLAQDMRAKAVAPGDAFREQLPHLFDFMEMIEKSSLRMQL